MKKVLVIEDDLDILEAIQLTLEINGYEVKSAIHGDDGLELANHYQPDLIILDYFLAGSNGATLCQTLKRSEGTKEIPVMMTSAHPSAYKVVVAHGADSFIAKPFSIGEFMEKVSQSMSQPSPKDHDRSNGNHNGNGNGNHCS